MGLEECWLSYCPVCKKCIGDLLAGMEESLEAMGLSRREIQGIRSKIDKARCDIS
jgi:hypothetical protein